MSSQDALSNWLILHNILSQLPQIDLLLCQRVCTLWRHTITDSEILQQNLFLKPDYKRTTGPGEINGVLADHFAGFFPEVTKTPLIADHDYGIMAKTKWYQRYCALEEAGEHDAAMKVDESYANPDASWRRMVPSRPAPEQLQLVERYGGMVGMGGVYRKRHIPKTPTESEKLQITFGHIHDWCWGFYFPDTGGQTTPIIFSNGVRDDAGQIASLRGRPRKLADMKHLCDMLRDSDYAEIGCWVLHTERVDRWMDDFGEERRMDSFGEERTAIYPPSYAQPRGVASNLEEGSMWDTSRKYSSRANAGRMTSNQCVLKLSRHSRSART